MEHLKSDITALKKAIRKHDKKEILGASAALDATCERLIAKYHLPAVSDLKWRLTGIRQRAIHISKNIGVSESIGETEVAAAQLGMKSIEAFFEEIVHILAEEKKEFTS